MNFILYGTLQLFVVSWLLLAIPTRINYYGVNVIIVNFTNHLQIVAVVGFFKTFVRGESAHSFGITCLEKRLMSFSFLILFLVVYRTYRHSVAM